MYFINSIKNKKDTNINKLVKIYRCPNFCVLQGRKQLKIMSFTDKTVIAIPYCNPPLYTGDTFQDPQWMPETSDSTKLYLYILFFLIRTYI